LDIKTRLQINTAISVLTALVSAVVVILTLYRVNLAREETEIAGEIVFVAFERSAFRSDYLQTDNQRSRTQWYTETEEIGRLLESAFYKFRDPGDLEIIAKISESEKTTIKLFSELVENREKRAAADLVAALETETSLMRQLNMRLYDYVLNALALRNAAGNRLSSALTNATWIVVGMIVIASAATTLFSWSTGRIITSRISKLRTGTSAMGERHLDYRIAPEGNDEFTELSEAFNTMAENLKESYAKLEEEIADRKLAEERLRKSEERLRLALEAADLGTWSLDLTTDSAVRSLRHDEIWGYSELQPQWGYEIAMQQVLQEDRSIVEEAHARAEETGTLSFEARVRWPDGSIHWIAPHGRVSYDSEGRPVRITGVVGEITGRKRAEQEREQLIAELERSNRELEQFAYISSHDLQEPLRMVTSYMQLLEKRYSGRLDEKSDKYINYAVEGAQRMQKLIEGLLAYSRIGTRGADFKPVVMNNVVDSAAANLKLSMLESDAVLTKEDLPLVYGDEPQLIQLLQNLLGNSIKFRKSDVAPKIHIAAQRKGHEWVFSVSDNGIGISPEYFDRIFQIFQRLHSRQEYPGTGIGLALCKRIIERHYGRIWVESAPGEGSTFFFTIPVQRGDTR
jgi:PAS domain S-box-containing protein